MVPIFNDFATGGNDALRRRRKAPLTPTMPHHTRSARFAALRGNDPDTVILMECEKLLGAYPSLYQLWSRDGYWGESFIFCQADIAGLSQDELLQLVQNECPRPYQPKYEVSVSPDGYTWLNASVPKEYQIDPPDPPSAPKPGQDADSL